jgi:hypothetical protein
MGGGLPVLLVDGCCSSASGLSVVSSATSIPDGLRGAKKFLVGTTASTWDCILGSLGPGVGLDFLARSSEGFRLRRLCSRNSSGVSFPSGSRVSLSSRCVAA